MTEGELEAFVSSVSMGAYRRTPEWDQPKILEWAAKLQDMPDDEFLNECSQKILDSAIMNRFSMDSAWGAHARADICADEARRRHEAAGHTSSCRGDTIYTEGLRRAYRSQGHAAPKVHPCTCGKGEGND